MLSKDCGICARYSVVIDSTAPNNITREFLLTTEVKAVNRLLVVLNVNRDILIKRNIEKFDDAHLVFAGDKHWEKPKGEIPILKFNSNNKEEFDAYYASLKELLESETHPFKPQFRPALSPLKEIRRALKNFFTRPRQKRT